MKSTTLKRWKDEGWAAKLAWYKAVTENTHWDHEQKIPAEAIKLTVPVLFIGGARDPVAPAILGELVTKQLCVDYTGKVVDSAHWILREKPEEWLETVEAWLKEKF